MKKIKKINYILFFVLSAVLLLVVPLLWGGGMFTAYADTSNYSNVLDDLQKDGSFSIDDYPVFDSIPAKSDKLIEVVQIAESNQGELLVYAYQPYKQVSYIKAVSINIAREFNNSVGLGFSNYPLTFLSSDGVFYKYRVDNFELRADAVRYYNISNILRPYEKTIDGVLSGDNTSTEVANEVGQFWTVCTVDGEVSYAVVNSEVVTISDKYVGYVEYCNGKKFNSMLGVDLSYTQKNFVAFSTDYDIDNLVEVEVQYNLQTINYGQCANAACFSGHGGLYKRYGYKEGEKRLQPPVVIRADEEVSNPVIGWGGTSQSWKRIVRTADFLADENNGDYKLTAVGNKNLSDTQWVLNFYNSTFSCVSSPVGIGAERDWTGENASDIIILRLKFEKSGRTFNLGVVDNKQTGSGKPVNVPEFNFWNWLLNQFKNAPWWAWLIVGIISLAIILPILGFVFPVVGNFLKTAIYGLWCVIKYFFIGLWTVIKYIAIGIYWVVSLPFRLIVMLIRKIKGN